MKESWRVAEPAKDGHASESPDRSTADGFGSNRFFLDADEECLEYRRT